MVTVLGEGLILLGAGGGGVSTPLHAMKQE